MKLYRCLAVMKRVFRDLINDKRTPVLMFVAPLLAMFVFGLAFSGEVRNVSVLIVNRDEGFVTNTIRVSLSEEIISHLDAETLVITVVDDKNEALQEIENGEAVAAIVFPEHLTTDFIQGTSPILEGAAIEVIIDKSNVNVASTVIKAVNSAVFDTVKEMGKGTPITVKEDPVYGENATFMDYFVPGILSFTTYLLTVLLTLIAFVGERISGTLDRLLATPLKESEIVAGYAAAFGILGTMQSAFLLTVGILVFGITIVGNVALAFVVIALLAIVSQSLGILLSSLAKREVQAIQFLPLVVLPAFLLSGIFWPVEAIPSWLRPASYFVPPTYGVDACRAVLLRGWGLDKIWGDLAALILFASFFLIMATWSLKRRG